MTVADFARTPQAQAARRRKAHVLADAAASLDVTTEDLALMDGGVRRRVLRAAGVAHASEETWFTAAFLLGAAPVGEKG